MNIEFGRVSRLVFTVVLAASLLAFFLPAEAAEPNIPRPVGYVNDFAHVVEPDMAQKITAICQELDEKTGTEITVATFPDIGGESVDYFASKVFEEWMPGQKGIDNGILILDAVAERQLRIETGYGIEPVIPDAVAGRIRREIMNPLLSQQRRGEAYFEGVATLAQLVAKEEGVELESLKGRPAPLTRTSHTRGLPAPFIIFIILAIVLSLFRRRGGGFRGGGPWIGGGGPFIGGFGGGGFGGGGGGFGGFGGGMSGGGGSSGGY